MNVTRIVASLVAVGLVAGSAMAQTAAPAAADGVLLKKGTVLFGGNLGWSLANNGGERSEKWSALTIAPEINYFIVDNISVGLIPSVTWKRYSMDGDTGNYTDLMAELVGRYYVPACNNRIIPYVGVTLGGGSSTASWSDEDSSDRQNTLTTYGVQAGLLVPLTESVMLDTRLSYKRTNTNGDRWDEIDQIGWDHDLPNDRNDVTMQMGILVKM